MDDYIQRWLTHLVRQPWATVPHQLDFVGKIDKHLGAHWSYAEVSVSVTPNEGFQVVDHAKPDRELSSLKYPNYFVFGLLDVLTRTGVKPILNMKVVLFDVKFTFETSPMSFYQAGQDAGRQIKDATYWPRNARSRTPTHDE